MAPSANPAAPRVPSDAGYQGPTFRLVDQIAWQDFPRGGLRGRTRPLLIRGALAKWPAMERWSFERLAELRHSDGSPVETSIQIGLAEQGTPRYEQRPVKSYMLDLAQRAREMRAAGRHLEGLLPAHLHASLTSRDEFHLDWTFMQNFSVDQAYISLWHMLEELPALKKDLLVQQVWPGLRWDWAYSFIGPGRSVTGIHFDYPTNLFCQFSGVKEFMLFPPDQDEHMHPSRRYDWGGKMSLIDITRLDRQPEYAASFARAHGLYARVEPGDALFVPRRTWHTVVSLLPSVSLAVFGLSPWELVIDGIPSVLQALLHKFGLYGRGNCTCHKLPASTAATSESELSTD